METAQKLRKKEINSVKKYLLWSSFPRVQVAFIVALTAICGFLTSFLFLKLGFSSMALRYPIAIFVAYCAFLIILKIWLWIQKNNLNLQVDMSGADFGGSSDVTESSGFTSAGGDFHGGGGGGNWGESSQSFSDGDSVLNGVGFDLDLEELWLVILAIVALIGGILSSFYIIYIAPILLAEILVDGLLVVGLYSRVGQIEKRYWLKTAIKRTIVPAILAVLFFTLAGFVMQKLAPEAVSIGQVFNKVIE